MVVHQSALITPNLITAFVFLLIVSFTLSSLTAKSILRPPRVIQMGFSQTGDPRKVVIFRETNFIGFHNKSPSNMKAIHYILCFCGWTLIVFLGLDGISLNNYENDL